MTTYTSRQVAEMTGKSLQAISRYAQKHPGIGQKFGRDWIFSGADLDRLMSVRAGRPTGWRKPHPTQEPTP
jgi:hypothetical protein